jgi:hypothetical protein
MQHLIFIFFFVIWLHITETRFYVEIYLLHPCSQHSETLLKGSKTCGQTLIKALKTCSHLSREPGIHLLKISRRSSSLRGRSC